MPIMCQALYYMLVIYQLVPKKHDFYHQRLCNQKARQNLNKKKCNHFTKKKKKSISCGSWMPCKAFYK